MNEKEFFNNREYICAYCLNKNEDKLCDDYSNDCNKVNVLRNDYSDYLEDCITELLDEKQQLISFLKDNIKKLNNQIKIKEITQQSNFELLQEISELRTIILTYQEILDYVSKGGKDE